jgi:zinc/manganese transport system permease protein
MDDLWLLTPALALALAVLALGPLGVQVLRRGVVFIDLAIAQSAAAAALAAVTLADHPPWFITQGAATLGALVVAGAVALLSRRWPPYREALIGLIYVASASLALLTAHQDAHGAEHLHALLAADVLWSDPKQVSALAACALVVLASRRLLDRDVWFFPIFAIVTSVAVQTLGLFVVFAALITPGLWQRGLGRHPAIAHAVSVAACAAGLALSWILDAPSGPWVALSLALAGVMSAFRAGIMVRTDAPSAPEQSPPHAQSRASPRLSDRTE